MQPPIEPMLAKLVDDIPDADGFLFEPKWDGFRSIVFRSNDDVYIQSRDLKPLDRYFPELHAALLERLPAGCVVDGEIVIATSAGLDFDALQLRLHPAASRVEKLSKACPSSFVAFDLLAEGSRSIMDLSQRERRARLEQILRDVSPPVYLTPVTRDRKTAVEWLKRFEGAGLDGVIAKPEGAVYQPGKRAMLEEALKDRRPPVYLTPATTDLELARDWFRRFEGAGLDGVIAKPKDLLYEPNRRVMLKIKHQRTVDCAVAGFRWH